jgi:hypothetical protein
MKTFRKVDKRKYCEECRAYAKSYKHKNKVFKLSKADIAEMIRENTRKNKELSLRFETQEPDCLKWREMFEKRERNDFFYNHIAMCAWCGAYIWRHRDTLDVNDTKGKSSEFEELKSYETAFKPDRPFPEDFTGYPYPMPMQKCCSICGNTQLRKDGSCPVCSPEE